MERVAVFVDAGYVWAAAGQLICGTMDRARIVCDYAGLTMVISGRAPYGQLLRLYWYDAAANATPTGDHFRIAELPYVSSASAASSGAGRRASIRSYTAT